VSADNRTEARSRGLADKLGFAMWGIRYFDVILVSSFPNFGAVLAMPDLSLLNIIRLAVFNLFNIIFVTHVFIYNDWCDAKINPSEPDHRTRHALKRRVLSDREILGVNAALLVVSLIGFGLLSIRLLVLVLVIEAVTYFYSQQRVNLKGIPVISLFVHFITSFFYVLAGWILFREFAIPGFFISAFMGLVMVAGHFFNEIDDFEQDLAVGIRTNAVAFGQRSSFHAGMLAFIASSAWFLAGSRLWLTSPAYTWLGGAMLAAWLVQYWRYRKWKGGDSIKGFRSFYRAAYALFALALFSIKLIELASVELF